MTSAAPRYAGPRAGGCGRRVDAGEGELSFCGTRPAPLELRMGPGGKTLARLCEPCGEEVRAEIARLKANGVRFRTDLVVERVELT